LHVLEAIEHAGVPAGIRQLALSTGVQRTAVYRLLSTLESRGYILRLPDKRYIFSALMRRRSFGYMAPLAGNSFREDLVRGMRDAAAQTRVELTALDNAESDSAAALLNAQKLIGQGVDLAVLGALQALREAGCEENAAVAGQNAS
jgi:DNA-binding IclR family transcriptional regulator